MWLVALAGAVLFVGMIVVAFRLNETPLQPDDPANQNHFRVTNNSGAPLKVALCDSPGCTGGLFLTDPVNPGNGVDLAVPWVSAPPQWLVLRTPSDAKVGCLHLNNSRKHSKTQQILVMSVRPCPR